MTFDFVDERLIYPIIAIISSNKYRFITFSNRSIENESLRRKSAFFNSFASSKLD